MRKKTFQSNLDTTTTIDTLSSTQEVAMSIEEMQKLIGQLREEKAALEQENDHLKRCQTGNNIQLDKIAASQILSLINNTSDFILAVDQTFKILAFNEPMRQVIKSTQGIEIAVGTHLFVTIQPDKHLHYSSIYARVLAGERLVETTDYLMPNGTQLFFEESFNPIRNEQDEIAGFTIISRDITERKEQEVNLIYRENVLNSIFYESVDALFLTNPANSLIIQCNKRANELFEMNSADSLINNFVLSFHKRPLKAKELKEMDNTLQQTGYWHAEIEYITAQGNTFWGNVTTKRIQISEMNYNLIRVTDIQEKKKAEEKIKWYSARLEGVIESTQDIIFSLDKKLRFTSFNFNCQRIMKQMYGVDIELGMKIIDTLRAFELEYKNTRKDMARALQGEQFTVEHTFGSAKVYFETHLNPIRNDKEEVTGVAVFAKDITERKRAEEKLLVSLREKDVLLSEVYHRVKNNLHVVISLLTLQSNRTDDPRVLEALNESKNRIYAMALVHEQLYRSGDMSRINTKEYIISLAQNVREIYLRQTSRVFVRVDAEEHIHFPIDIAIPIGLILNELLTNSFKHAFTPGQDGEIGVKLADLGQHNYRISVLDNGKGFNLAEITAARPTSLGLRIVEMLVEQMKGEIQFLVASREEVLQEKVSGEKNLNEIQINFKYPKS